jgi:hypothetical protein
MNPKSAFSESIIALIVIIILVLIGIVIYLSTMQAQCSPINLATLVKAGTTTAAIYPKRMTDRKSLYDYLLTIGENSADNLALSNFYVMTANLGGFFSPVNKAAFCTEAIQYAINGGARCIIFDIWPDLEKGKNMGPILKVCVSDTDYKKLSCYTLDLDTALQTVRKYSFEDSANPSFANPARQDPMFLFFRFRGNPTVATLTGTAESISRTLEQYRLAFTYTNPSTNKLPVTPITNFYGKVIILSNQNGILDGVRTRFADYVNNPIVPSTPFSRKSIASPGEIQSLPNDISKTAQQSILACAPLPEDTTNSESNGWNWKAAQAGGIQLVGLNLWVMDSGLNTYTDPSIFGTYSFMIKPDAICYKIERVKGPIPVTNLGYGTGAIHPS